MRDKDDPLSTRPRHNEPVAYRTMFIRAVFDDPEERYGSETDLRKALTEHLTKFPGISGATVEMRR